MYKKKIKDNSVSKNLCVLDYQESQEVFGAFFNEEMNEDYKTRVMRSELRGIDFDPIRKHCFLNHETLNILEKQFKEFSSVFYLYKDVYENMKRICLPRSFSTPYYVEELECPTNEFVFVFNDSIQNPYTLNNYQEFTAFNEYPKDIIKVNDCILRSKLAEAINIEGLKSNGLIRENFEGDIFNRCLEESLQKRLDNDYFSHATQAYNDYMFVKNKVEGEDYINQKLIQYESEYFILKNVRVSGAVFNRDDFTIDRIIVSKSGVYVASLINWSDDAKLHISSDNQWSVINQLEQKNIKNPTEENSLNCIAIKQILRTVLEEEILDKLPIIPLIIVTNDNKEFTNESKNEVIRGSEIYRFITNHKNFLKDNQEQLIANTINEYNCEQESFEFLIYLQDLESIKTVYEDIYYNHINVYLPQLVELIWKVKKEDYYETHIKNKKISSIIFGVASVLVLAGVLLACILYKTFIDKFAALYLYNCLVLVLASNSYFEYQFLLSWKNGNKEGECFEVNRSIFAWGGLLSLLAFSGIMTFLLMTIQNVI